MKKNFNRKISEETIRKVKIRCVINGITLDEFTEKALISWLD